MHHDIIILSLDDFIKGILVGYIRNNDNLKAILLVLMSLANLLSLVFRADSRDDGVTAFQQLVQDVSCEQRLPSKLQSPLTPLLGSLELSWRTLTSNEARTS